MEDDDSIVEVPAKPVNQTAFKKKQKHVVDDLNGSDPEVVPKPSKAQANSNDLRQASVASFGHATRSPSRRSAAAKAGEKLKNNIEDMNHFQKEITNGRVRGAWEKELPRESMIVKNRSFPRKEEAEGEGEGSEDDAAASKKRKREQEVEKSDAATKKKRPSPIAVDDDDDDDDDDKPSPKQVTNPTS
jgi:hypothetical protein